MSKYIIFGTGITAQKIYEKLNAEDVLCFLETYLKKETFCGKEVHDLEWLEQLEVNKYKYYLGSIANCTSMCSALERYGVRSENIMRERDYSIDNFMRVPENIRKIALYPKVVDTQVREGLDYFLQYIQDLVEIDDTGEGVQQADLVLVWDKAHLDDAQLTGIKWVFCIDNEFYKHIRERILVRLVYRITAEKYEACIRENWMRFFDKKYKRGIIMGNGPSMEDGLQQCIQKKRQDDCVVVCNAFVNVEEAYKKKCQPDMYALFDILFFEKDVEEYLSEIVHYCVQYSITLLVPEAYTGFLLSKYPQLQKLIIGFEMVAEEIVFPSRESLKIYPDSLSVVTTLCVPVLSALCNEIYISGCDGLPDAELFGKGQLDWDHASIADMGKKVDLSHLSKISLQNSEFYIKYMNYFERVLAYGEQNGVSYYSYTKSYIPCLKERMKELN